MIALHNLLLPKTYTAISKVECDEDKLSTDDGESGGTSPRNLYDRNDYIRSRGIYTTCMLILLVAISLSSFLGAVMLHFQDRSKYPTSFSSISPTSQATFLPPWPATLTLKEKEESCVSPPLRYEWRALTLSERQSYISAVMCLRTLPSRIGLNHSIWEDFPYVHVWYGHDGHDGVSFFAYHRWMLTIYESALRDQCGYTGRMIYWDWTLDWQNPYAAPVFDPVSGWGGNGDPAREEEGYRGGCINDGPLVGTMHPYVEFWTQPHCLSRKFLVGEDRDYWARQWHPDHLEELLQSEDLNALIDKIEYTMHRALPKLVGGDFTTKGAPMDPLFFLHHTQLDRIYWMWQQRDPGYRLHNYVGRKTREDEHNSARISDLMFYGDLGPPVTVNDTMTILGGAGGRLCYRYW